MTRFGISVLRVSTIMNFFFFVASLLMIVGLD